MVFTKFSHFAKIFSRNFYISLRFRLIYFREKMQNFAKKFAKCERKFSRNVSFAGNLNSNWHISNKTKNLWIIDRVSSERNVSRKFSVAFRKLFREISHFFANINEAKTKRNFAKIFSPNLYRFRIFRFINFREKMRNFVKKFTKCEQKF